MSIGSSLGKVSPKAYTEEDFDEHLKGFIAYTGIKVKSLDSLKNYKHLFDVPTLVGIEIEVENIGKILPLFSPYWVVKNDLSLRNNGKEFMSIPVSPRQAFHSLALLWEVLYKLAKPDFSWRTSIHFHLNVLELGNDEVRKMMLLSLLFEDLLFEFVGRNREQSIFCVPLHQSTQMSLLRSFISKKKSLMDIAGEKWNKYSAVNLSRIPDLGTVEFRHLGGTDDLDKVLTWLSFLLQIYQASVGLSMDSIRTKVLELNTSSKYWEFVTQVFTPDIVMKMKIKDWESLFKHTISKAKDFFVDPIKFPEIKDDSTLAKYAIAAGKKYEESQKGLEEMKLKMALEQKKAFEDMMAIKEMKAAQKKHNEALFAAVGAKVKVKKQAF
jgi:hypothetical protein